MPWAATAEIPADAPEDQITLAISTARVQADKNGKYGKEEIDLLEKKARELQPKGSYLHACGSYEGEPFSLSLDIHETFIPVGP